MFTPSPLRRNLEAAIRDLRSTRADVRASSARDLSIAGQDDPRRAADALVVVFDDATPDVRAAALHAAGALRAEHHLDAVSRAVDDGDATVRQQAVIALGEIGGTHATARLREAVRSERGDVRFQALIALSTAAPNEGVDCAIAALGDDDAWVAAEAATQLGLVLGGERAERHAVDPAVLARAREALRPRLDHSSPRVALSAAMSLARLGDSRGLETMVAFIAGRSSVEGEDASELRIDVIELLGAVGDASTREALHEFAWRWAPTLERAVARAALARLGDARAIEYIESQLKSPLRSRREAAVHLAAAGRVRALVPVLVDALRRRRDDVAAVVGALGLIGDSSAVPDLESLADDPAADEFVRDEARAAVAALRPEPT